MMNVCEKNAGLMMRIASPDSVQNPWSAVSSVIPRHVLFASCAGEKNGLWGLRESPAKFLRSQDPSRARSLLWRHSGVLGVRDPSRVLPELRHREARDVELVGRQPVLHQALRLLRGSALSGRDYPGCSSRTPPELEDGQGPGDRIHA